MIIPQGALSGLHHHSMQGVDLFLGHLCLVHLFYLYEDALKTSLHGLGMMV